jgi:3-deoxy-D-arabino-heptulosonate 7-phosphate (DAHP) synthase
LSFIVIRAYNDLPRVVVLFMLISSPLDAVPSQLILGNRTARSLLCGLSDIGMATRALMDSLLTLTKSAHASARETLRVRNDEAPPLQDPVTVGLLLYKM